MMEEGDADIQKKLYMLSPLQREILDLLLRRRVSWSAHEIWAALINEFYDRIVQKYNEIFPITSNLLLLGDYITKGGDVGKTMEESKRLIAEYPYPIEITISRYLPPKNITGKEMLSAMEELKENYKKAKGEKNILYCKLKFVRHFYRFPTVKKVEEAVNSLVCLGILSAFSSSDKRVKNLYCLNPSFAEMYDELKKREQAFENEKLNRERPSTPHSP